MRTSNRTRAAASAAVVAALVLPAGCAGGDDGESSGSGKPAATTKASESATPPPTPSQSPTPGATPGSAQTRTALRAIATAQQAVKGGKVFDLESDTERGRQVWEAKAAGPGGRQFNLDIAADGGKVVSRHQDMTPDDDVMKLRSAKVSLEHAIRIATARAKGQGQLSSLEIDTSKGGTVVWQISFGGDSGTTVVVDARSAKVLGVGSDVG